MPFFQERPPAGALPRIEPRPEETLDVEVPFTDTLAASFDLFNTLSTGSRALGGAIMPRSIYDKPDPTYDVFDDLAGYEDQYDHFVGAETRGDVARIKATLDRERLAYETMRSSGTATGLLTAILAGAADPLLAIPIMRETQVGLTLGRTVGRSALRFGATGLAISSAQEAVLQNTVLTRTPEEGALALGGATFLSALLGAAVPVVGRAFQGRRAGEAPPTPEGGPAPPAPGGSVGAATARSTDLADEVPIGLGTVNKAVGWVTPQTRVQGRPSVRANETVNMLVETPTKIGKNVLGEGSEIAAETEVKGWMWPVVKSIRALDDSYIRYRTDKGRGFGSVLRAEIEDMFGRTPEGKLSIKQFREEVWLAANRGDKHDIPAVAEAARAWRENVMEPLRINAAETPGFEWLAELGPTETASYMMRVWNHTKIRAQRPALRETIAAWYAEEQATKAAIQAQIGDLQGQLARAEADIAKIEGRIATREARVSEGGTRLAEAKTIQTGTMARGRSLMDTMARAREATPAGRRAARVRETGLKGAELSRAFGRVRARINAHYDRISGAKAERVKLGARREDLLDLAGTIKMEIDDAVAHWPGKSATADEVMAVVTNLSDKELRDLSDQTIDRILSTPDGRLPYDAWQPHEGRPQPRETRGVGRPLNVRDFAIPNERVMDFLEKDINVVGRMYARTMAADLALIRRFGDVRMTTALEDIRAEYAQKIASAPDEKARIALDKQRDGDIRDISAMRDLLRGTYALPANPEAMLVRTARAARHLNVLRLLGGMVISSTPDVFKIAFTNGMARLWGDAIVPLMRDLKGWKMAAREVEMAGTALDLELHTQAMLAADIFDQFGRGTKFERGLHAATQRFSMITLMSPWNAGIKRMAGVVTQKRMLQGAKKWVDGTLSDKERTYLAFLGMDENTARRIADQFDAHGEVTEGGLWWANTADWTDANAIAVMRNGIVKETDRTIVTPGIGDIPLMGRTELGKLIFQFKTFNFASMQRTAMAGLQQKDAAVLAGMMGMVTMGMMGYVLTSVLAERPLSDDPKRWIAEGLDRSGLLFWFSDVANTGGKFLGWSGSSRYASRDIFGATLGPSFNLATDLATIGMALTAEAQGEDAVTASTIRKMRTLLPLQNWILTRNLLNMAERGINTSLGIPERKARRQ